VVFILFFSSEMKLAGRYYKIPLFYHDDSFKISGGVRNLRRSFLPFSDIPPPPLLLLHLNAATVQNYQLSNEKIVKDISLKLSVENWSLLDGLVFTWIDKVKSLTISILELLVIQPSPLTFQVDSNYSSNCINENSLSGIYSPIRIPNIGERTVLSLSASNHVKASIVRVVFSSNKFILRFTEHVLDIDFRDGTGLDFWRPVPVYRWLAGLKFILEPLLSLNNDKWCRELETKTVYILSGRYSWDPAEFLYIFTWKKQNFNVNTRAGLPVTGTGSISDWLNRTFESCASSKIRL
jgi:hypothetical protein